MTCVECGAKCCRYVATQIDTPTCKRDYDNIRWYLLHKDVYVFKDHEGDWFIEFAAECKRLGTDSLCADYGHRPRVCRHHGEAGDCEFADGGNPYALRFSSCEQFEAYLDERGIDWKWKR